MRILIAEDSALLREGLVRLVSEAGHQVVAAAGDVVGIETAGDPPPDVAILDIRMPPTYTDEGARAALTLRQRHPTIGILLLSQHIEAHYALRLMREHPRGLGYLLKDRVLNIQDLLATLDRVAAGGFAVDPEIVTELLDRRNSKDAMSRLTVREKETLALIAEGHSNTAISQRLHLSSKTVENHVSSLLAKLDLLEDPASNRRVRAVLLYLDQSAAHRN